MTRSHNLVGMEVLGGQEQVDEKNGAQRGQVALAWKIALPSSTSPIVSATSLQQLSELAQAATLKLDDADIKTLNDASSW